MSENPNELDLLDKIILFLKRKFKQLLCSHPKNKIYTNENKYFCYLCDKEIVNEK